MIVGESRVKVTPEEQLKKLLNELMQQKKYDEVAQVFYMLSKRDSKFKRDGDYFKILALAKRFDDEFIKNSDMTKDGLLEASKIILQISKILNEEKELEKEKEVSEAYKHILIAYKILKVKYYQKNNDMVSACIEANELSALFPEYTVSNVKCP